MSEPMSIDMEALRVLRDKMADRAMHTGGRVEHDLLRELDAILAPAEPSGGLRKALERAIRQLRSAANDMFDVDNRDHPNRIRAIADDLFDALAAQVYADE